MRISMKEIWRNLDSPPKTKKMWSYVVKFEFSRPKVALRALVCVAYHCMLYLDPMSYFSFQPVLHD